MPESTPLATQRLHGTGKNPAPKRPLLEARRSLSNLLRGKKRSWLLWLLFAGLSLLLIAALSILGGYGSGRATYDRWQNTSLVGGLQTQFNLGVQEFASGSYDRARQRFEYVIQQDPSFPGVQERLAEVLAVLSSTATPSPPAATITPTPTRDLRPVEDLFNSARLSFADRDWDRTIDLLVSLRKADPQYRVAEVDGMLYLALRNRGVDKIANRRNLEGGTYDLALAERFGPLDAEANAIRELARLYALGLSFWEVYPEQAVYYFGQVAAASPYLTDASGWTAQARYVAVLLQWADQLSREDSYCLAQEKYQIAQQAGASSSIQATIDHAAVQCNPPTETPGPTSTFTPTPTDSATVVTPPTGAATTVVPTAGSPTQSPSPSPTVSPTGESTSPGAPTQAPSSTPTPTQPVPPTTGAPPELSPTPTETPSPSPTEPPAEEPTAGETRPPPEPANVQTATPEPTTAPSETSNP